MRHTASAPGANVALTDLRPGEWLGLTFGLFWRTVLWSIVASMLGTVVMFAVTHAVTTAMRPAADPTSYVRVSVALTVLLSLGVSFRWYARWILAARYGTLRLAVVRAADAERPVAAA